MPTLFEPIRIGKIKLDNRIINRGVYFANGGFSKETGAELLASGGADAIVYGNCFWRILICRKGSSVARQ
jgi:2,4-dienoyl-CoA reductase-like NADH-dependent reductase (Old Yellow Enzyme family)